MRGHPRWSAAVVIVLGPALAGCAGSPTVSVSSDMNQPPAIVEAVPGTDVKRVTLTEAATSRLGVETVRVAAAPAGEGTSGGPMTVVPYPAVLYSPDGATWVFIETSPRSYVRQKVAIANVGGANGSVAWLSDGPAVGTPVVSIGIVELYGAELGIGE